MKYCAFILSVFLIYYISPTFAWGHGGCDKSYKEKDNDYKLDSMLGTWYENATYSFGILRGKCTTVEIGKVSDDVHSISTNEVHKDKKQAILGQIVRKKNDKGRYEYTASYGQSTNRFMPFDIKVDFKLVDTDYKCWAIVYYCYGAKIFHLDDLTILLKTRDASCMNEQTTDAVEDVLKQVLKNDEPNLHKFRFNEHDDSCNA